MRTIRIVPCLTESQGHFHIFQDLKNFLSTNPFSRIQNHLLDGKTKSSRNLITFVDVVSEALKGMLKIEIFLLPCHDFSPPSYHRVVVYEIHKKKTVNASQKEK